MATSTKTEQRTLDQVLDDLRFAMVTTASPDGLSARPLTLLEQEGNVLRFLVSRTADWVRGLERDEHVQVSFADPGNDTFVSLTGTGRVLDGRALIEHLWNPAAEAWFDGPDDPNLAALEVQVHSGEWWDGPSGMLGQAVAMLRAAVTDDPSKTGDSGRIQL